MRKCFEDLSCSNNVLAATRSYYKRKPLSVGASLKDWDFAMALTRSMIISPLPTPMTSLSVPSMSFLKESRHQVFAACSYQGPVFPSRVLMGRGAVIDSGTKCIRACQELLQPLLIMPFCNLVFKKLEKYVAG